VGSAPGTELLETALSHYTHLQRLKKAMMDMFMEDEQIANITQSV